MKRLTFLIMIWLAALVSEAQPNVDGNWLSTPVFIDNFNTPNSNWDSLSWIDSPNNKWKAAIATGATHGNTERMVYRKSNAIFDMTDQTMKLKAEYAGGRIPNTSYEIPGFCSNWCYHPSDTLLYYYSGAITAVEQFKYGYFEIQCKLPVNLGAFPAFWLYDSSNNNYREIDIFEYSWNITTYSPDYVGTPRFFMGRIYYGSSWSTAGTYGLFGYTIPDNVPNLTEWHTFGLEWSPGYVSWYLDNTKINSYRGEYVPNLSMNLMVNNAVDNWAAPAEDYIPITQGFPNNMTINYVKVFELDCECQLPAVIQNQNQFNEFDYKVYNSITIGGYGNDINVPSNTKVTFRATNNIIINGNFSLPIGSCLELMTHPCPEYN